MSDQERAQMREQMHRLMAQLDSVERTNHGTIPHPLGTILRIMRLQIESLEDELVALREKMGHDDLLRGL